MAYELHMGDDGILRVILSGDLGGKEMESYAQDCVPYIEAATAEKPLHFLVDVSQLGKASAAARKAMSEMFKEPAPGVGRTALIGASRYVRVMSRFITKATGTKNLRLFAAEEEAVVWLKGAR